MCLRIFTTCLAVLITASTGVCQTALYSNEKAPDPNAPTPAREILLLNPDGTPATDAKAVAVLLTPGGVVDQDLKPRPVPNSQKEPLSELVNDNGTVTVITNETKAIVASNEQGFLFLPASAFDDTAKLREWAHVELDVSTVPEDMRADITINCMWTNSLQGQFVRPKMIQELPPFGDASVPTKETDPELDWRFDPMITWTQSVPVTNERVRVPPGEIIVALAPRQPNDQSQLPTELLPGSLSTTVGLWQTQAGTVQKIALPEFGSLEGTISSDPNSTLPDWSKSGGESDRLVLNQGTLQELSPILTPSGSNDEYFKMLTSDQGFNGRRRGFQATTTSLDGKFRFPLVPVGTYSLAKLVEFQRPPRGMRGPVFRSVSLKSDGDRESTTFVVKAKDTTVVNVSEQNVEPLRDAFGREASTRPTPLPEGAEVEYVEETRIVDGKAVTLKIPRVTQQRAADPFARSSDFDRHPDDDPATQSKPRNDRFFWPDDAAAQNPKPDAATTLIQNWLRSVKDPSDQTELRKLLQDHLQQEFEATQASRKAEVERLQKLLQKSVEWLDERSNKRDEIIQKRIDDLIRNSAPQTLDGR